MAAFIVEKLKIAYFPVPKCACSSAKLALYEAKFGTHYNGKSFIHMEYPSTGFSIDDIKDAKKNGVTTVCIVRDPISRLRSAYFNRVIFYKEARKDLLEKAGIGHLPELPTFDFFVSNLSEYQRVETILHHTEPLTYFLGNNAESYDLIFSVNNMDLFFDFIDQRIGRPITRYHYHKTKYSNNKSGSLSRSALSFLMEYYKLDYEVFGEYCWQS